MLGVGGILSNADLMDLLRARRAQLGAIGQPKKLRDGQVHASELAREFVRILGYHAGDEYSREIRDAEDALVNVLNRVHNEFGGAFALEVVRDHIGAYNARRRNLNEIIESETRVLARHAHNQGLQRAYGQVQVPSLPAGGPFRGGYGPSRGSSGRGGGRRIAGPKPPQSSLYFETGFRMCTDHINGHCQWPTATNVNGDLKCWKGIHVRASYQ